MKRLSFVLICALTSAHIAWSDGIVSGYVTDQYGYPAPDLTVIYTYTESGIEYSDVTNESGYYSIPYSLPVVGEINFTLPEKIALFQNYPNPFNPGTIIPFEISFPGEVNLTIYNIQGTKIKTIHSGFLQPGSYNMYWNGTSDNGKGVAAGIYICQLQIKDSYLSKKMVLLDGQGGYFNNYKQGNTSLNMGGNTIPGNNNNGSRFVREENIFDLEITGSYIDPYYETGIELIGNPTLNYEVTNTLPHTVNSPNTPSGPEQGEPGVSYTFSTSGGSCSLGHQIDQYKFYWNGPESSWGSSSQSYSWSSTGNKSVKAKCKCDAGEESSWSGTHPINIQYHTVSSPSTPSGPAMLEPGQSGTFSTSGGSCSWGHNITHYKFYWNGPESSWGSSSQSYSWSSTGNKSVKAKCKCSEGHESDWSGTHTVNVQYHTVSSPSTPSGPDLGYVGDPNTFSTSGGSCSWGHSISQYKFDWDIATSSWGSNTQTYTWNSPGDFDIRAKCKCSESEESGWSGSHNFDVYYQDTCNANEDAYITTYEPSTPHDENTLWVGYNAGDTYRILVDFPTSSIPSNAEVYNASLHICPQMPGIGTPFNIYIAWIEENWSESSVTWNNQPVGYYWSSHYWQISSSTSWTNFAITDEMEAMLNAGYNEGFMILATQESGSNHYKWFYSSETSFNPYIEVVWRPPTVGEVSTLPPAQKTSTFNR